MSSPSSTTRTAAAAAQERVTGRRFCTQCQSMREPAGGVDKPIRDGRATRFVCAACVAKWTSRRGGAKR